MKNSDKWTWDKKVDDNLQGVTSERWLYVSRKRGGRGLISIGDCTEVSIQGLEHYIKKNKEGLITVANNITDNIGTNNNNNEETKMERKTTVWVFQATNYQNLTGKDQLRKGTIKKGTKSFYNSGTKQNHKDQLYLSENQ